MVQRYWGVLVCVVLIWIYMTGCPPVAALDPIKIGDEDVSRNTVTASSCVLEESPYVYPVALNYRYTGKPIVYNQLAWGINYGMSGISPFLKWQVFQGPAQLYVRAGAGGFPIPIPMHLFGIVGHYHGDMTFNLDMTDVSSLYLGAKSFGMAAYLPESDSIEPQDSLDLIDEGEFVQGVWVGGFLGYRIKSVVIEAGVHRVIYGTYGLEQNSFDNWSPSIGISYIIKSKD